MSLALATATLALGLALGVAGERLRVRRASLAQAAASPALAEYAETIRELARTTQGAVPPDVEAAIGRMLALPRPALRSGSQNWEIFVADFGPEKDGAAAIEMLREWANQIEWTAERRQMVVSLFKAPPGPDARPSHH